MFCLGAGATMNATRNGKLAVILFVLSGICSIFWLIAAVIRNDFVRSMRELIQESEKVDIPSLLLLNSSDAISTAIKEGLVKLAVEIRQLQEKDPANSTATILKKQFNVLHESAERLGTKLGPHGPYYDLARRVIESRKATPAVAN